MLIWLQVMLSLLRPPGINILIGILSLYYWIRSSGGKAILLFFISLGLLYGSSIPLVSDKLIIKLESKYRPFKTEVLPQYQNVNAIVAVFSDSYLSSDFVISQNMLQLSRDTKLPAAMVNLNNYRLYGTNAEPINSYIINIIKLLGDGNISLPISIAYENNNPAEQSKYIQETLEKNKIQKIFLISDSWNIARAQQISQKYGVEVVPIPIMSNLTLPKSNKISSFIPNGTSLLRSELFVKIYLDNFLNQITNQIKKVFKKF
ncbi:MAG: hypothetical protein ACR2HS_05795 [Gammaproteobacteria bacterium]